MNFIQYASAQAHFGPYGGAIGIALWSDKNGNPSIAFFFFDNSCQGTGGNSVALQWIGARIAWRGTYNDRLFWCNDEVRERVTPAVAHLVAEVSGLRRATDKRHVMVDAYAG